MSTKVSITCDQCGGVICHGNSEMGARKLAAAHDAVQRKGYDGIEDVCAACLRHEVKVASAARKAAK